LLWIGCGLAVGFRFVVDFYDKSTTNRSNGVRHLTYTERLKRLKLSRLELRRFYNDLTWCYKILFGYVDVSSDEFFAPSPAVGSPLQIVQETQHYPQQTNVFQRTCH